MIASGPELLNALSQHELGILRETLEFYAAQRIDCFRWRGDFDGVLPEGFDPASIVAEAFKKLLADPRQLDPGALPASIRQPADDGASAPFLLVRHLLRRLIDNEINRLYRSKENSVFRNEPDLGGILTDDDDCISPVEIVPAPDPTPLESLLAREAETLTEQFKARFVNSLGNQGRLKRLFEYLCADFHKPGSLARHLGLRAAGVLNLKKRLRRLFQAFRDGKFC